MSNDISCSMTNLVREQHILSDTWFGKLLPPFVHGLQFKYFEINKYVLRRADRHPLPFSQHRFRQRSCHWSWWCSPWVPDEKIQVIILHRMSWHVSKLTLRQRSHISGITLIRKGQGYLSMCGSPSFPYLKLEELVLSHHSFVHRYLLRDLT